MVLFLSPERECPNFTEDDDYNEVLPPWNQWDGDVRVLSKSEMALPLSEMIPLMAVTIFQEVVLADTITVIGASAFEDCWDLEEIRLPSRSRRNFVPMQVYSNVIWKYWKFRKR